MQIAKRNLKIIIILEYKQSDISLIICLRIYGKIHCQIFL